MTKEQFKKLRKKANKSQQEIADYIGKRVRTVQRYESGVTRVIPRDVADMMRAI